MGRIVWPGMFSLTGPTTEGGPQMVRFGSVVWDPFMMETHDKTDQTVPARTVPLCGNGATLSFNQAEQTTWTTSRSYTSWSLGGDNPQTNHWTKQKEKKIRLIDWPGQKKAHSLQVYDGEKHLSSLVFMLVLKYKKGPLLSSSGRMRYDGVGMSFLLVRLRSWFKNK